MSSRLLYTLIFITTVLCFSFSWLFNAEIEPNGQDWDNGSYPPFSSSNLPLGSYQWDNLAYVVLQAARLTIVLSFLSLTVSIILGFFGMLGLFLSKTSKATKVVLSVFSYLPRLFLLILLCALLGLDEPSSLAFPVTYYLVLVFGVTGSFFLASQTSEEILFLKSQIYVYFAYSLKISSLSIFFRHVLWNCTTIPIVITKQFRDNLLFLSTISFLGIVHLQPEDLGGLICKYYSTPEAFIQGWWILFFPCAILCWIVLLFDRLAEQTATKMKDVLHHVKV